MLQMRYQNTRPFEKKNRFIDLVNLVGCFQLFSDSARTAAHFSLIKNSPTSQDKQKPFDLSEMALSMAVAFNAMTGGASTKREHKTT